jgi:hypothetical protein
MRREPTEAQKKASAERKEKLRALVKAIGAMPEAERQAMAMKISGVVTCEGRSLSVHNQCMIAFQSPFATVIGGFNQWRKVGRSVKRGEHGFVIWAPAFPGTATDETLQPPSEDGEAKGKQRKRFILVTMFDIAQTQELDETERQVA